MNEQLSDERLVGAMGGGLPDMYPPDSTATEVELAEWVHAAIGDKNLLLTDEGLYGWNGTIWERLTDDGWRHQVQRTLKAVPGIKLSGRKVASVATLTKTDAYRPGFEWPTDQDDAVACLNGVVRFDGDQWSLEHHQREDYRTSTIPVEWKPEAEAPRFQQFLMEVFQGDEDATDKARALLEMMGYTLMRHTRHERFIILVGRGANGKSVLLSVLVALCGTQNVAAVSPDQLDRPFQRAALFRMLANIITELKQGEQIQDGALKSIVSGEPSTVEQKFKHPFTMRPYATQWYGTNHMPHTRDFSFALFRRALIVPFNRKFSGDDADPNLTATLTKELPGILRLSLEAYGNALRRGKFTEPESCLEAKDKWRLEADQVARFAEDRLEATPGSWILLKELYQRYREWADEAGIRQKVGKDEFIDRMERLDYRRKRLGVGIVFEDIQVHRPESPSIGSDPF
jgi:putative DNA primase/helicase